MDNSYVYGINGRIQRKIENILSNYLNFILEILNQKLNL